MSRPRIKSKTVRSTINNKDVMEMFQGVLGTGEGTPLCLKIVYPKYCEIRRQCRRFLKLLVALRDWDSLSRHFVNEKTYLAAYISDLESGFECDFSAPDLETLYPAGTSLEDSTVNYKEVTKEVYESFSSSYTKIKTCNMVNTVIVTCKNLVTHKRALIDVNNLKDRFLTTTAGNIFSPLPDLPSLNFKKMYITDHLGANQRLYLLVILHKMYTISHDLYESVSSPDIDVEDFTEVIMQSLQEVQKHIPRCDGAFRKIADSVGLLKGNFGDYYKDFVESNNPTIIMENFVLDVSKSTDSTPEITRQFRQIISHYRKLASSQQANNPQLKSLFSQVDKNFTELEKESRAADDAAEDEDAAGATNVADAAIAAADAANAAGDAANTAGDTGAGEKLSKEERTKKKNAARNKRRKMNRQLRDVHNKVNRAMETPGESLGAELARIRLDRETALSAADDTRESPAADNTRESPTADDTH